MAWPSGAREAEETWVDLRLTEKEVALLRTGLEMLEDTFGHEEADELEEVQALLAKLRRRRAEQSSEP